MRSSSSADQLGSKLTPKLIQAVSQSVIATKRGLMDTEHKVMEIALQHVIDRAGHEFADLHRPVLNAILESGTTEIDPMAREFVERVASGEHQWEAIAGITSGAASGAISTIINNYLADPVRNLVARLPSLSPDIGTIANLYARGWLDQGDALYNSRGQGYSDTWFDMMYRLAQNWPDLNTLFEMMHRGVIDWPTVQNYLHIAGVDSTLFDYYYQINTTLLTPADAALGVLRGDITEKQGRDIANANGLTDASFDVLLLNTGEPPGLMQLLEAFRRGYINEDTLQKGVLQSRIRDEWWPTIFALRYEPPSTADAIQASIQGYITKEKAKEYAQQNGLDPDDFEPIWATAGEPLSRTEMTYLVNWGFADMSQYRDALKQSRLKDSYVELASHLLKRPMSVADAVEAKIQGYITEDDSKHIMSMNGLRDEDQETLLLTAGEPIAKMEALSLLRRGLMTKAEVEQALRESRLKDKYIPDILELATVYPGIYDIRLLLSEGAIDDKTAAHLLAIEGYPADLIAALIAAFSGSGSTANKAVTEAMIVDLYLETAINATELHEMLKAIGYSDANATIIQEVADWRAELAARNAVIAKVKAQYTTGKIDDNTARNDLLAAVIPASVVDKVMGEFDLIKAANVKLLSESQVVNAWNASLFNDSDPPVNTAAAVAYLERLGYGADDADILLQLKNQQLFDGAPSGNAKQSKKNASSTQSTGG